ncbi:MAG: hypothetical protein ACRC1K_24275 [Planctomycetia bacterium]
MVEPFRRTDGRFLGEVMPELSVDTHSYRVYSEARRQFLRTLGCEDSCRDPLSEFAERLVNQQLDGVLAVSRVQKNYDLVTPEGRRVQVKYLANPVGGWRNPHNVSFSAEQDDYAVVFFEDFDIQAVVLFRRESLAQVCKALMKRHPDQDRVLQLTEANFKEIVGDPGKFEVFGVTCFLPASQATDLGIASDAAESEGVSSKGASLPAVSLGGCHTGS